MDAPCQHCKQVFDKRGPAKYCHNCRVITFCCAHCGAESTTSRTRVDNRKTTGDHLFCSRKCAIHFGSLKAARERKNGCMVECPNCGTRNYRSKTNQNRRFCNQDCYGEYRSKNPDKYLKPSTIPEIAQKIIATRKRNKSNYMLGRYGPKHHLWAGGKIHYRGPSWPKARNQCIMRDGMLCVVCGAPGHDIHHIVEFRAFQYDPEQNRNDILANNIINLIHLCRSCHMTVENVDNNNLPIKRVQRAIAYFESLDLAHV